MGRGREGGPSGANGVGAGPLDGRAIWGEWGGAIWGRAMDGRGHGGEEGGHLVRSKTGGVFV